MTPRTRRSMNMIREAFNKYDKDGNGSIDQQEFLSAWGSLGLGHTEEELLQMFKEMDEDGSGAVSYEEFREATFKFMRHTSELQAMEDKRLDDELDKAQHETDEGVIETTKPLEGAEMPDDDDEELEVFGDSQYADPSKLMGESPEAHLRGPTPAVSEAPLPMEMTTLGGNADLSDVYFDDDCEGDAHSESLGKSSDSL